jgi:hypothetical protein
MNGYAREAFLHLAGTIKLKTIKTNKKGKSHCGQTDMILRNFFIYTGLFILFISLAV